MIRALTIGAARVLFNLAVVSLAAFVFLIYASWRLLRASVAKDQGRPVREAGFQSLLALATLAKALQQKLPTPAANLSTLLDEIDDESAH